MNDRVVNQLLETIQTKRWGYRSTTPNATEPAAWACLALSANGLAKEALPLAEWMAEIQGKAGSVGVTASQPTPAWTTSLAILAWLAVDRSLGSAAFDENRQRAIDWALQVRGKTVPKQRQMGHDPTIVGWSWAENTHSWLEPTAFFVMALRATGNSKHPRTREGVRMIVDRQHEQGGWNYGNTVVLGQATLPHVQPTGIALLALSNEDSTDLRLGHSLDYLTREVNVTNSTASLCFAILGLTAHGRRPVSTDQLIQSVLDQFNSSVEPSCFNLALLALAQQPGLYWLPSSAQEPVASAI